MIAKTPMNPGSDVCAQGAESCNEYDAYFTSREVESAGFGLLAGLTDRQITRFWSRFQRQVLTVCWLWQSYAVPHRYSRAKVEAWLAGTKQGRVA